MEIIISNVNDEPIYEQIYKQIKGEIVSGKLKEDTLLPSIRSLAKDLKISVITTKRAYEELERGGFIRTVAGKGCYVAKTNTEIIREQYLKEIEAHIEKISELASACGLSKEDIKEMIVVCLEEK